MSWPQYYCDTTPEQKVNVQLFPVCCTVTISASLFTKAKSMVILRLAYITSWILQITVRACLVCVVYKQFPKGTGEHITTKPNVHK